MKDFSAKTVWITGASSGIGAGLARGFAREQAALILSGRREDELNAVADQCRTLGAVDVKVLPFETTDFDRLPSLVSEAEQWRGGIDVLINNAGISQRSLVVDTSMDVYRRILDIDFFAPVALTKLVLPAMRNRGSGLIVVTTSVAGKLGSKLRSGYSAAKFALHGFYESLRGEVHDDNIGVSLVVPGYVKTDVTVNAITGDGSKQGKREQEHDGSMTPDELAAEVIPKLKAGKEEIITGSGMPRYAVLLKRFFPGVVSSIIRKQTIDD